ncbi:MAG TPA: hypothetical protein VHC94_05320 [Nitrobacter sp.]|jgi:hypothetical protein|nr:hypothetical protein [Nitrobacter sp.]
MQIKPATRGFSVFVILVCTVVACGCVSLLVALLTRSSMTDLSSILATSLTGGALIVVVGWMTYCIRLFVQTYMQAPYFKIDIEQGMMTITDRNEAITVRSSDVVAYFLYNNKVRFLLREQTSSRSLAPFVKLKGERLTISLNRLDGRIPVTTWLHKFDRDFTGKNRASLGMIAQALGYGLS